MTKPKLIQDETDQELLERVAALEAEIEGAHRTFVFVYIIVTILGLAQIASIIATSCY